MAEMIVAGRIEERFATISEHRESCNYKSCLIKDKVKEYSHKLIFTSTRILTTTRCQLDVQQNEGARSDRVFHPSWDKEIERGKERNITPRNSPDNGDGTDSV